VALTTHDFFGFLPYSETKHPESWLKAAKTPKFY